MACRYGTRSEVDSRECHLTSRTWKAREESLSALAQSLTAHVSSPRPAPQTSNSHSQLPRLQSTDSNCSSLSSPASPPPHSPASPPLEPPPTAEPGHTCERCDSIGPPGIAREAVTKAGHIKGAKECLMQGLLFWLAAQVEEKVFSGALNTEGYLATMGAVAHTVASISPEPGQCQGVQPFWDDQPSKKARVDSTHGGGGNSPLAPILEWTSGSSESQLESPRTAWPHSHLPAPSGTPGVTTGLAANAQIAIDDVAWARHQLLSSRYLLHLQVCHLASLARIQEHFSGLAAPGGSARKTRVLPEGELKTLQDIKRMSLALVRFFAARRERVPSRFSIEKLNCLENESRSVLSAFRSKAAFGILAVPGLLLKGVSGLQRADTCLQGCHPVYQQAMFRVPSELLLPPAATAHKSTQNVGVKRPWCDMIGAEEGQGKPCFVQCTSVSVCQSIVVRGNGVR